MSKGKINNLVRPLVEELGYEFVGLEHSSNPKNSLLRVYIDHEDGIGLDDCSKVSREVAAMLDVEDPISGHYNLEISSPGLDRPLFTPEHYQQFAGKEVKLNLFAPENGRRKFTGRILAVAGQSVHLLVNNTEITLDFGNIAKAKLVPDFDGLMTRGEKETNKAG